MEIQPIGGNMAEIVWLEDNSYTIADLYEEISKHHIIKQCFEPNQVVEVFKNAPSPRYIIIDIMLPGCAHDIDPEIKKYFEVNDLSVNTEHSGLAVAEWVLNTYQNLNLVFVTALPDMAYRLKNRLDPTYADRLEVLPKSKIDLDADLILSTLGVK